jgi:hypothetical protein
LTFDADASKRAASYTKAGSGDIRGGIRPPARSAGARRISGPDPADRALIADGYVALSMQSVFGALLELLRGFLVEECQE